MRFYHLHIPLAVGAVFTLASSAKAVQPMPLYHVPFETVRQSFQLSIPKAKPTGVLLNSLRFVSQSTDDNHLHHIRMQQTYAGVPVIGGFAIMHSPNTLQELVSSQAEVKMTGTLYQHLETELGQPSPEFIPNTQSALSHFKKRFPGQKTDSGLSQPIVFIDDKGQAHWAYKVSVWVHPGNSRPQRPTAILDADTFKPFAQWDDVKTRAHTEFVQGMGYGGNLKTGLYQYGTDLPYLQLTRDTSDMCYMQNNDVMVIDMAHRYSAPKQAMKFPCSKIPANPQGVFNTGKKADGYDVFNEAYAPTNDALYAGNVIKDLYENWYKIPVLTKNDGKTPMQLVMRVHYGSEYENAYWDGKQMTFGDGGSDMYPLVSLGVAAHEISHGFTEQYSDLYYYSEAGAMNESFSDMAAQAAEFFALGKNSWQIGPEIMKKEGKVLRYMDKPSKDGKSFDDAKHYQEAAKKSPGGVEVHYGSGVYNHLFYILSHQVNWTLRKAFDVMVRANMYYWGPYERFDEGGCGMMYAAKDLGYSVDDVKKSLTEVAIDYHKCN
ncbi:MAG: M4 family metallopeptidase [Legionella sp.]|nr:M4 family metallopeptidase [Legionella sp.]